MLCTMYKERTFTELEAMPEPCTTTPTTGPQLEDRFCDIAACLGGDVASREAGSAQLARSAAARNGEAPDWSMAPKIFDRSQIALLKYASETMFGIMEATVHAFLRNKRIRDFFGLKDEDAPLVLVPPQNECPIPLARVDIFLNEQTNEFWFCETNTDGSAGFTATDLVTEAIQSSATYRQFVREVQPLHSANLRNAWILRIKQQYDQWSHLANHHTRDSRPVIALVDYLESLEHGEADDFVARLSDAGFDARLVDVRKLKIEEHDGMPMLADDLGAIDCVWKRAVTGEMLRKPVTGAFALAQAVSRNLACIIGSFCSWPVATKTFFALLHDPLARDFLSPEQLEFIEKHVPKTYLVENEIDNHRFEKRSHFIAKPTDGYNAIGVIAGSQASDEEWHKALAQCPLVVQEYAPQYATPVIPGKITPEQDAFAFSKANNMLGLFLFDGKFAGVFPRSGYGPVIGEHQGRFEQGCLYA